ncbi:Mechanosensitive ion channel-domain-containing protein [Cokeromyces recurvatus]|uniref:Mechanosensitive ion channel-domain-containing protein n=1 Tax=Cokeromyces recurvatus TaxID=90255 RepID=UPI00221E64AA|nr:Mechanosensitive ion channel-domain-containing protein [Cokeromyces recurvatus]KAI7897809.1 Mechanosensitive ion channel-domain-containing protein [Cokeromyces recurvatus]
MKDDFVLDTKLEDTEGDIDDDKDHDFNWNDVDMDEKGDADEKNTKRSNTYRRLKAVYDKYCFWHYLSPFIKRVVIAAIGSSVFITIGVCIYIYFPRPTLADLEDPNYTNVRDNVQVWMYWAAFMWHITWITTFMIDAVPHLVSKWTKFFRGGRSERVKSYLEYYQSLKLYIGLVIILAWNWGSWAFLIDIPYQAVLKQFYTTTIWRIFACLFVASVFLLVQKTIIQVIANRFHRFAFEDRIKNNKKAIKVLDILGKVEYRNTRFSAAQTKLRNRKNNRPTLNNQQPTNETIEVTSGQSSSVLTNDFTINNQNGSRSGSADLLYSFKKNLKKAVINDHPRAVRRREELDINSDDYARKNAKKLYISLAYPQGVPSDEQEARRCLLISDFEPYFKTAQEAKIAFDIFDRDGNGDITRREFRDTVLHIYRERKDIAISMRDTSQVLGKIDFMLLIVSLIALLLTSFAIFNVEVWHSLVPLGSLLLAMTFVFGNTAKNTFESILFLFVTHPYDTGDYVLIDGQYLLVHNMGIMGTTFISGDGQTIYAPTTVLMTKLITNVRRSGNMGETIKINVDFRTTTEQFYELHDRLSAWVLTQHRDFGAGLDVRVQDIIDVNQLILNIWLPHKGNWQELGKRFKRKTRFMLALKDILNDLNIRYELPTQKITHTTPNGPSIFNNQSYGHASQLEVSSQSFDTTQLSTPSDPREAAALEAIKKERIQRGRYNVDHSGSASSTGDGGW